MADGTLPYDPPPFPNTLSIIARANDLFCADCADCGIVYQQSVDEINRPFFGVSGNTPRGLSQGLQRGVARGREPKTRVAKFAFAFAVEESSSRAALEIISKHFVAQPSAIG